MVSGIPYLGIAAYLVLAIFLMLPSGYPQPADALIMLTVLVSIVVSWRLRIPTASAPLYTALTLFCLWVVAVNTAWHARLADPSLLVKSAFYIFNAVVMAFVAMAGQHDWARLRTAVRWACIAALLIQAAHLVLVPATTLEGARSLGTMENPNQLGYWALLAMACLAVAKDRQPLGLPDLAALTAGGYALILSLSKAATLSGALLILLIVLGCGMRRGTTIAAAAAVAILVVAVAARDDGFERALAWQPLAALDQRLNNIGEQGDDDLMSRGYALLFERSEYLILGASEADMDRFRTNTDVHSEIHSTLGNLLFAYGMVGLALFGLVLLVVFRHAPLIHLAYFMPLMLYGLTHMGLRATELWIFLGLVYAQGIWGEWAKGHLSARTMVPVPARPTSM